MIFSDFITGSWSIVSFLIFHAVSFIWLLSGLNNRVRFLEKELENYKTVHERLAKLEAMSFSVAESVRRIEAHLLRMKG
jgi:hypothetical protein